MTALDDEEIVGHLILRYTDPEKSVIRFGFVIVDDSRRGMGYGKMMLKQALDYAFNVLKAEKVTLGVLENDPPAYHCYIAAGFRDITPEEPEYYELMGQKIKCLEVETERGRNYALSDQ